MRKNYILEREKQILYFNGKKYLPNELEKLKEDMLSQNKFLEAYLELYAFLKEWFNDKDYVEVQTSGSTGTAKEYKAMKENMMQSALRTCDFLSLPENSSVLLCMPLKFIGAKMIVVRALVAGLDLYCVPASLNPMKDIDFSPYFVAMTPQQASASLKYTEQKKALMQVKHLMLGGMAVMPELEKELFDFPHSVWLTYGMTETLSHIALRKLNKEDASSFFTPFNDVKLSLSKEETLIIDAPFVCKDILVTNDRAILLDDMKFQILGRVDNVVNSGGIKIQIEEIEEKLASSMPIAFRITSLPHKELGEQLVLLTEENCPDWKERCSVLSKYQVPKMHIQVEKLPLTDSGKPDRLKAKKLAQEFACC